jgi:hypothetical protein
MDASKLDRALDGLAKSLGSLDGLAATAVLYGSAARGDWVPGKSDVNVLLLVSDASPASLRRLTPAVTEWHTQGFVPPLIMGREEWTRSADVFPIEITDMRLAHRVLCGIDPLTGMVVDPADLREAVEKELRGKLVRLRQAYVRFGDSGMILGGFALASVTTLFALFRCIAVLHGREPGRDARSTAAALRDVLGDDVQVAVEVASHRTEREWNCMPETFVRYIELVRRAVEQVDTLQNGAH